MCNKKYIFYLSYQNFVLTVEARFFCIYFLSIVDYNDNTFSILHFISSHSLAKQRRKD